MRRTNETIRQQRELDWLELRHEGYNLFTMCLACGEVAHCRGKSREGVRCESCFKTGASGARIVWSVLHERIREEVAA